VAAAAAVVTEGCTVSAVPAPGTRGKWGASAAAPGESVTSVAAAAAVRRLVRAGVVRATLVAVAYDIIAAATRAVSTARAVVALGDENMLLESPRVRV